MKDLEYIIETLKGKNDKNPTYENLICLLKKLNENCKQLHTENKKLKSELEECKAFMRCKGWKENN